MDYSNLGFCFANGKLNSRPVSFALAVNPGKRQRETGFIE